jgi:methionyl-tRNA synthetase
VTQQRFYLTTAISYPNGKPHIGHAYEAVCADAIARFHRLMGRDVRFLTGTDEHGLKMVQTAAAEGVDVKELADRNSNYFKDMCATLDVVPDRFIRTTDEDHKAVCQDLWRKLAAKGDISLGRYEGWYSVRDEAYFDEKELTDGEGEMKLAPSGAPVEWTVEESYFFKLSAYEDRLLKLYEDQPQFIQPDGRRNEIVSFVRGGLRDLSISRNSFTWGIPVPDCSDLGLEYRPGHVMYVWIDALANYLTGARDGNTDWWPADLHIIGKDIVRFHAVYWPAFLMSAKLPLPKQVFGHGFLLNRGEKMSKSLGNVVDPMELVERYGADAVRYYFLRKVSFGEDGGFSAEDIIQTYNSDLANSFGNLVQRVFSFIAKNLDGRVPVRRDPAASEPEADQLFRTSLWFARQLTLNASSDWKLSEWMAVVFDANKYVDGQAPWALKKTDPLRMEEVLAVLLAEIRNLAIALQPFAPTSAAKVLAMFGPDAFSPRHIVTPAKAGAQTNEGLDPGLRRNDGDVVRDGRFTVLFDAINDHDWYDRWAASGFIIQPPVPIFPRLEMPKDE